LTFLPLAHTEEVIRRSVAVGSDWLPAPTVVVLANYAFAVTGHPRCAVVALAAEFAGLIAVAPVGQRVAT